MGGLVSQFCRPSPYNAQIGTLDLTNSMANQVLEAVAVSKLCVHKKCVVWVACNLFLLLANERIKTTLAGNWHLGQNKMAWSKDCGYVVVFVSLDHLSIQYYGNNGDCLVHALPEILMDMREEFYYEVVLESDSGSGRRLVPCGLR
ncbi:uncharacterized protein ACA1_332530 [Acanthamoeba castellanii str. Neff]|uniref:Uncharacterized protein n=1 Tax=Acanthamoeba castellanii (strain ATCC 30010 / Neff) TaxID=1257118 RepID=L8GLI4_ACACF|nr:uncharacterized protein ACA1_332530 [Acanthamoeba castellanii str. Neff]ELR13689.1 hypothetical protein ACA1_332530 [Acanthamoeba castellanii str. Neff]